MLKKILLPVLNYCTLDKKTIFRAVNNSQTTIFSSYTSFTRKRLSIDRIAISHDYKQISCLPKKFKIQYNINCTKLKKLKKLYFL